MLSVVEDFGDFRDDLLAAKERDLTPLAEESAETLDLEPHQRAKMEAFLDHAWFGGTYTGHAQVRALAETQGKGPVELDTKSIEAEFKALMEAFADSLNLSLSHTVVAWNYLGQAWLAGVRSSEAQLAAHILAPRTDVAGEVERWLERRHRE